MNILTALILFLASCGTLERPETPTLTALNTPGGISTASNNISVYSLYDAQISWDVSYIAGATGVRIILARDYNCNDEIVSKQVNYINSQDQATLLGYTSGQYNPVENLGIIFQDSLSKISPGTIYVCIRAISGDKESPPSYPGIINLLYGG